MPRRSATALAAVFAVCSSLTPALAHADDLGSCGKNAHGFFPWLTAFRAQAVADGISPRTVSAALADVRYDAGVVRLDRSQTPFKKTFDEFVATRVTPQSIAQGRRMMTRHADLLAAIRSRYAVPGHVLVALWGLETGFGAVIGDKPVFRSLATLAYDCRRAERFRGELASALRIVENGDLRVDEMRGAWAGELGQTQFLASSYEKYAVDFDGDGRADLLHSTADVLASTANYLYQHFWQPDGDLGPGTANFVVLGSWNKSENYQRTIALYAEALAPEETTGPRGEKRRRKPRETVRIAPAEEP
jgi:membrane-bound lytic murein transglycosylase B